ncbi:MAG: beta-galactosidase, partial [Lentisphaerales bacterium]|nr:beta-galactosidase [Lentisphaerales bacterium]
MRKQICSGLIFFMISVCSFGMDAVELQESVKMQAQKIDQIVSTDWKPVQQDLSKYEAIEVALTNHSSKPVTVWAETGNNSSRGAQDRCSGQSIIAAGAKASVKVRLMWRPKAPSYKKEFERFFMFFKGMNVRDNTIDPTKVSWIKVWFKPSVKNDHIEIHNIKAVGHRQGQQPPFFPFVDKYGQYKHVDWPGKVYSDSDLKKAASTKAGAQVFEKAPTSWNKYGGWENGPTLKATGNFYAAQHKGKWWLVDPSGKLFWSYGPTGVGFGGGSPITDRKHWFDELPSKNGEMAEFYGTGNKARFKYYEKRKFETYNFAHANLKRMYGENWQDQASAGIHDKMRTWGFNTMAAWSDEKIYERQKTPYVTMIHFGGPWISWEHHYRMPAPFDEGFRLAVREALEAHPKTATDPWNIGYCINNELGWGAGTNGNKSAIATLAKTWGGAKSAAKSTFINDLKAKYKNIEALNKKWGARYKSWEDMLQKRQQPNAKRAKEDLDAFSAKVANEYFKIVREEVKRIAPNHMYLGCRFHGHIDNSLMAIAMKYVDVVTYNIYQNEP